MALALLLQAKAALAADVTDQSDAALVGVEVRLVGSIARDPVLADRIASWFDKARFRVNVAGVRWLDARGVLSPQGGASVYVWVTVKERRARLYFANLLEPEATYLLRDLPLERGLDEIGAEQVAQAIHFSTLALLEGQLQSPRTELEQSLRTEPSPSPSPPSPPPSSPPTPVPKDRDRTGAVAVELSPGVGYGLTFRGDAEGTGHGPRASLTVALSRTWLLGTRVSALLPLERRIGPFELDLYGGALALTAGVRQSLAKGFAIDVFAGPGLELVHYEPALVESSGLTPGRAETEMRPQLVIGFSGAFGQRPCLAVIADLAINLSDTHYDIVLSSGRQEIARPWLLMPSLGLELRL